jgi:hypothetical protein
VSGPAFGVPSVAVRWLGALFGVLATYNPSGSSYVHWLVDLTDHRWSLKALVGILLMVMNMTFYYATVRSIRSSGIVIATAFCIAAVWTLLDYGYLQTLTFQSWITVILTLTGSILALGLCWSHFRGRLTGQSDSNDITL